MGSKLTPNSGPRRKDLMETAPLQRLVEIVREFQDHGLIDTEQAEKVIGQILEIPDSVASLKVTIQSDETGEYVKRIIFQCHPVREPARTLH